MVKSVKIVVHFKTHENRQKLLVLLYLFRLEMTLKQNGQFWTDVVFLVQFMHFSRTGPYFFNVRKLNFLLSVCPSFQLTLFPCWLFFFNIWYGTSFAVYGREHRTTSELRKFSTSIYSFKMWKVKIRNFNRQLY